MMGERSVEVDENQRDQFRILDMSELHCEYVQDVLKKYILGLVISRDSGEVLYYLQIDRTLKIDLFANFIAALSIFGNEIGEFKRIYIEGLNIELNIVSKHGLIVTAFFRPDLVSDHLDEESEKTLDLFYEQFKDHIESGRTNQLLFEEFDNTMCKIIREFFVRIGIIEEE